MYVGLASLVFAALAYSLLGVMYQTLVSVGDNPPSHSEIMLQASVIGELLCPAGQLPCRNSCADSLQCNARAHTRYRSKMKANAATARILANAFIYDLQDLADSLGVCICHDWPAMDYWPRLQGWSLWQGTKYSMCCPNGAR